MTAPGHCSRDAVRLCMRLAPAVRLVESHLADRLSIPDLALEVGISPYHFVRLFKRTAGLTPHQYVVSRRVERARQLLEDMELSIAVIAIDTGFSSRSHLTERFGKEFGVTPAMYRARRGRGGKAKRAAKKSAATTAIS